MKRKIIALLLSICTLSTLVACGTDSSNSKRENDVQENIQENVQEESVKEESSQNNSNNNEEVKTNDSQTEISSLLNKYPNQKICDKAWTEMTFILDDKEYELGHTLSYYNLEEKGYYPTLSIIDIDEPESLKQTTVKKQDSIYYCKNGYNLLEPIELNLINPTSEELFLYDCTVNSIIVGASLYTTGLIDEYSTFSINGLRFGDSEDTLLEKLGTDYTDRKISRDGVISYTYKNETQGFFIQLNDQGIILFQLAQKVEQAESIPENTENETEIEGENQVIEEEVISEILPSENWEDMEVVINGNLVDLDNFSYQELTQLIGGRLADNYNDKTLKSEKQYMMSVWLYEEIDGSVKDSLTVNFYNPSNEEQLLKDCKINLIGQSLSDKEETKDNLIFSKGLTPGLEMSVEDVINLFGEPTEIDESKSYKELIYNAGNKKFIIRVKDNKINGITLSFKYEE